MIKYYRRLCSGLGDYGSYYPVTDTVYDHIDNLNTDWYTSVFLYTEDQKNEAEKIIKVRKNEKVIERKRGVGNVTDIDGEIYSTMVDVHSNFLVFDFDDEKLSRSKDDAITLINRMIDEHGIPEDSIQIYFSGGKGFHVQVELNESINPDDLKSTCQFLATGLETFDTKIYNPSRILRVPLTRHKTGKYKIPLTLDDLKDNTAKQINEIASTNLKPEIMKDYWKKVDQHLINKLKEKVPKTKELDVKYLEDQLQEITDIDFTKKPQYLSAAKYVLEMGFIPSGHGQDARMILAASYRKAGKLANQAYHQLKATSENRVAIYGEGARFDKDEMWNNVISTVYSDSWQGGTYGNTHPLLFEIEEQLPTHLKRTDRSQLVEVDSVFAKFKTFATDIDKNTLKLGIESLDSKLSLLTGTSTVIVGAPGCHIKGTKVIMFNGSVKNVEDIKVGDVLMGPDSKQREVLNLCCGRETMVKISPNVSEPFTVNMNHILNLTPSGKRIKKQLGGNLNMTVRDYIDGIESGSSEYSKLKLHKTGINFCAENELHIDPYFLGLWLGDGTTVNQHITVNDTEIYNYLEDLSKKMHYKFSVLKDRNVFRCSLTTPRGQKNPLLISMQNYGLIGKKHIPKEYLTANRDTRLKVLAGLIDTDGCLSDYKQGHNWELIQKSERLSNDIVFLIRSLGYHCSIDKVKKSWTYKGVKKWGDYYRLYIAPNDLDVNNLVKRKKLKGITTVKNVNNYGFKYEILEDDNYYGFTLDKDHLYLTSDFIIHHNSGKTSLAMNLLKNNSICGEKSIFYSLDIGESLVALKQLQMRTSFDNDTLYKMVKEDPERFKKIQKKAEEDFKNVDYSFRFGLSPDDIRNDIIDREDKTGEKIRLVVVDYLENVFVPDMRDSSMASGVAMQHLSNIANELDVAMVVLAQTQKSIQPGDEIISMRCLKGSSVIEQAVSVALTMSRPAQLVKYADYDCVAVINCVKNRYGALSRTVVGWEGARSSVHDITKDEKLIYRELQDIIEQEKAESAENRRGGYGW